MDGSFRGEFGGTGLVPHVADKLEGIGGLVTDQISLLDHAGKVWRSYWWGSLNIFLFPAIVFWRVEFARIQITWSDTQVSCLHPLGAVQEVESRKRIDGGESVGGKVKLVIFTFNMLRQISQGQNTQGKIVKSKRVYDMNQASQGC